MHPDDAPDRSAPENASCDQNPGQDAREPSSDYQGASQRLLEGDVAGLIARVDQLDAGVRALDITALLLAFALGATAGLVYLNARRLQELAGALGG